MEISKMLQVSIGISGISIILILALNGFDFNAALPFLPISIIVGFTPYFIYRYIRYNKVKMMESSFPDFLRMLSESQKSGINLPQATVNASKMDYGPLNEEIKKMSSQISWGIPFPKVLKMFSDRVQDSKFLRRSIAIILESFRSGGDVAEVMNSVADSSRLIKDLEADRTSKFNQQLVIMYAIYLIFIVIIIALNRILLPMFSLSGSQDIGGVGITMGSLDANVYRTLFFHMIIMQAIFSGLLAGLVGEGSLIAGFKHLMVMLTVGTLAFALFIPTQQLTIIVEEPYEVFQAGTLLDLTGTVLDNEKLPLKDAEIRIIINDATYVTLTDNVGMFYQKIILPTRPGKYKIEVEATSGRDKGKTSIEVTVG